jgi:hypothetical protein
MNTERLQLMITMLREIEAAEMAFNLGDWISSVKEMRNSSTKTVGNSHACGTVACAMGYAAMDPRFREQGMTARASYWHGPDQDHHGEREIESVEAFNALLKELKQINGVLSGAVPQYNGWVGINAADEFFEIGYATAEHLFIAGHYILPNGRIRAVIKPSHVIRRIEKLIELGEDAFAEACFARRI